MKNRICLVILFLSGISFSTPAQSAGQKVYVSEKPGAGYFQLAANGTSTPLLISADDYKGVALAAKSLQNDIKAVTKTAARLITVPPDRSEQVVIMGTIGKDPLIDRLIAQRKVDVKEIAGKWEAHISQVVRNPLPGIGKALVIAGTDKRGTIYGIYELSAQIGVSPWYWWADVPAKQKRNLYVMPGRFVDEGPAVKYRGIFINDEAPSFSGWAHEKFGGVNHRVYEKMFELILRLKGNYLWPAMWGNAFNDDDKLDPVLADEYGVVMGTSHHEPMDRAQQEWKRYGSGAWNYATNGEVLRNFWKKGIENMGSKETIVTVGMRGDGDMPMTEGSNIALLEKIVYDQRKIIADVTRKDTAQTPQMWALYKEVQDYYDKGMRVPDDVTLLLCDDNWGNIRKLPKLNDPKRKGGYGIYYHFDYVGDPRNYKWLNTNPISKTWEQMHLAYEYGARQVWIVNVGDLKPMEFPISFFLDYAWSPDKWPANKLDDYTRNWAVQQFGPTHAADIARILTLYTKYNGRRKPELLDQNTYSILNYREYERVVDDYNKLRDEARALSKKIPSQYKDAYYELVQHPVEACANLNELYYNAALNKLYTSQGRAAANITAEKVKQLFAKDAEIAHYYNKVVAGGKWDHMMDQTHIGYTYWQQPPVDKMPDVATVDLPSSPQMGIAVEGSASWWPQEQGKAVLPAFSPQDSQGHYIEIFNRGEDAFDFTATSTAAYVKVTPANGKVAIGQRLIVNINWTKAPKGKRVVPIIITGPNGTKVQVDVPIDNRLSVTGPGFYESNGDISIEAEHFSRSIRTPNAECNKIPGYGRTLSGVMPFPVTMTRKAPGRDAAHLEYDVFLADTGNVKVNIYIAPTIDFTNTDGLHYAVSIDDEQPQIVNINDDKSEAAWAKDVSNNIKVLTTVHHISKPGKHVLKYWMVDPAVVLQKIVIDMGGEKPSYLGPPESFKKGID